MEGSSSKGYNWWSHDHRMLQCNCKLVVNYPNCNHVAVGMLQRSQLCEPRVLLDLQPFFEEQVTIMTFALFIFCASCTFLGPGNCAHCDSHISYFLSWLLQYTAHGAALEEHLEATAGEEFSNVSSYECTLVFHCYNSTQVRISELLFLRGELMAVMFSIRRLGLYYKKQPVPSRLSTLHRGGH